MENIGDFLKTQKLDEKLEKGLKAGIEAGLKEGFGEEQVDAFVKKVASLIKDNNMTVEKALSVANVPDSVKDTISMKVDELLKNKALAFLYGAADSINNPNRGQRDAGHKNLSVGGQR